MHRLRTSGTSLFGYLSAPQLKKKASSSWSAVQDAFFLTKDIFERHRVVFTVSTSILSVATAWTGYTLRHLHESRVDQRLESIERAMKNNYEIEHSDFKKLTSPSMSFPSCAATAGTTLVIGYCLGWRGGKWYANRSFRREQMKLLGQIKPKRWPLKLLKRPLIRPVWPVTVARKTETSLANAVKQSETLPKDNPVAISGEVHGAH